MTHYQDDDLVLYYYGEGRRRADIDAHLGACADCAAAYRRIADTLSLVTEPEDPARDDRYGEEVWQRIRHQLPLQERSRWVVAGWLQWDRLSLAGAATALAAIVLAAFIAGRLWPRSEITPPPAAQTVAVSRDAEQRARLAAIGDHLERSERVLLDFVNASTSTSAPGAAAAKVDVSGAQAWAADLVDANRLYRQAAERDGDTMVADVLDQLERQLLDIVHAPSTLTQAQLDQLRVRLDAATLLFKVRVLHDELRERETAPAPPRKTT